MGVFSKLALTTGLYQQITGAEAKKWLGFSDKVKHWGSESGARRVFVVNGAQAAHGMDDNLKTPGQFNLGEQMTAIVKAFLAANKDLGGNVTYDYAQGKSAKDAYFGKGRTRFSNADIKFDVIVFALDALLGNNTDMSWGEKPMRFLEHSELNFTTNEEGHLPEGMQSAFFYDALHQKYYEQMKDRFAMNLRDKDEENYKNTGVSLSSGDKQQWPLDLFSELVKQGLVDICDTGVKAEGQAKRGWFARTFKKATRGKRPCIMFTTNSAQNFFTQKDLMVDPRGLDGYMGLKQVDDEDGRTSMKMVVNVEAVQKLADKQTRDGLKFWKKKAAPECSQRVETEGEAPQWNCVSRQTLHEKLEKVLGQHTAKKTYMMVTGTGLANSIMRSAVNATTEFEYNVAVIPAASGLAMGQETEHNGRSECNYAGLQAAKALVRATGAPFGDHAPEEEGEVAVTSENGGQSLAGQVVEAAEGMSCNAPLVHCEEFFNCDKVQEAWGDKDVNAKFCGKKTGILGSKKQGVCSRAGVLEHMQHFLSLHAVSPAWRNEDGTAAAVTNEDGTSSNTAITILSHFNVAIPEHAEALAPEVAGDPMSMVSDANLVTTQVSDVLQYHLAKGLITRAREGVARAATKTKEAIHQAAAKTGEAFKKAGKATEDAFKKAGEGISKGAKATGKAIKNGAEKTGDAIKKGTKATGRWFKKSAQATGAWFKQTASNIRGLFRKKKKSAEETLDAVQEAAEDAIEEAAGKGGEEEAGAEGVVEAEAEPEEEAAPAEGEEAAPVEEEAAADVAADGEVTTA